VNGDEVETMNWDAVIAVSEIIGVVAVIASLIYVGAQIRQNTDIARATIVHETSVSFSRIHELLADNEELSDIYVRGVAGESRHSLIFRQRSENVAFCRTWARFGGT
jgi:hypothetical protein